jgi:hypothetical protein
VTEAARRDARCRRELRADFAVRLAPDEVVLVHTRHENA